jgi:hypothetical protein
MKALSNILIYGGLLLGFSSIIALISFYVKDIRCIVGLHLWTLRGDFWLIDSPPPSAKCKRCGVTHG